MRESLSNRNAAAVWYDSDWAIDQICNLVPPNSSTMIVSHSFINQLRVERLHSLYDPFAELGLPERFLLDTQWLENARARERHQSTKRSRAYHLGRVRHFVDQLRAGQILDPIVVDNLCHGPTILPYPIVVDGDHRMIAHVLAGMVKIPAQYSGRVDLLRFLEGRRKSPPE